VNREQESLCLLGQGVCQDISHLPVVDVAGHLLGLLTIDLIRQILQPTALLKSKSVGEVMTAKVIYATVQATILQVAQLMVEQGVGSIIIRGL
jgi:CBS domain-containing protein